MALGLSHLSGARVPRNFEEIARLFAVRTIGPRARQLPVLMTMLGADFHRTAESIKPAPWSLWEEKCRNANWERATSKSRRGYGPAADKLEMIPLLAAAFEHGITFYDTAQVVDEGLAPLRGKVVIATKFGIRIDPDGQPCARRIVCTPASERPKCFTLPC
jgi:hypothetical protein